MGNRYMNWLRSYLRRSTKRKIWKDFVRVMAGIVVFCTTYALILPAITLEQTYDCGMEEHLHTDACYSAEDPSLLICTLPEHVHTELCKSDAEADVETAVDWEATLDHVSLTGLWGTDLAAIAKTQIGYTESTQNYLVNETTLVRNGYTRYGAWYGIPYGDWNAMFVSFCLNYAQIHEKAVLRESDPGEWAETLMTQGLLRDPSTYTPEVGDLIFLTDGEAVDRVGIVTELCMANDPQTGEEILEAVVTVQGDVDGKVTAQRIAAAEDTLYAYCSIQQAMKRFVLLYPEIAYGMNLVADTDPELLINFGDGTDTVTWTPSYKNGAAAGTQTDGALTGQITGNGKRAYIRFTMDESATYTIRSGDIIQVKLKMTDVSGSLGQLRFCIQTKEESDGTKPEIVKFFDLDTTSGDYVTYTITADEVAGYVGKTISFFDVGWQYPESTSTGTYSIDSIRIGQPEHEHDYDYAVTQPTCDSLGYVTYYCDCGHSYTVEADTDTVLAYAIQLRVANTRDDYSTGKFTWDTESKTWSWTYYNGVMLDAFMKVGTQNMLDYVVAFYDDVLEEDGTPIGYRLNEVDSVPMALALFDLLGTQDTDRNERYVAAIQYVYDKLKDQTVLGDAYGGNFWHKEVDATNNWYTWRFGLDGIYMALPFLMEYANALDEGLITNAGVSSADIYEDIYNRLNWVADTMYDEDTGLYHHGWNGTNGNGVFWGRGIGWYAVALVDIIDMMPTEYQPRLIANLEKLFDGMLQYQDAETGMWYNVVNYDSSLTGNNGNKLETSVSSMMAYALMKAYREGFVDNIEYYEAGQRALNGTVANKMTGSASSYSVIDTYKSSSVCTTPEEYLKNPYTTNEAKGVGALIMAAGADHTFGEWTVTKKATTASEGVETRTCSVCGATQTQPIPKLPLEQIGWNLTVVDPTQLVEDETYVIYCRPNSGDPDTYVFLPSNSQSYVPITVTDTGYESVAVNIPTDGETWTVTMDQMGTTDVTDFTWCVELGSTEGTKRLALQGYDNIDFDGPEYLAIRHSNNIISWYSGGTNYINLNISAGTGGGTAAAVVANNNSGSNYDLAYDSATVKWTSVASGSGTNVYFAKVTPAYEEPEETEDSLNLKVLGTDGPEEGKKYVIYFPSASASGGADVKILGSTLNLNKGGNFSFGVDGVEDSLAVMQQAGSTWTLETSSFGEEFDVNALQWTVVKVGDDWCLQSVADPTLYLKLVCTNDSGASQVNSTAYDDQGAQYFSLNFTSSGDETDSWYTITNEDGAYELRFNTQNIWQAIIDGYIDGDGNAIDATQIYFAEVVEEEVVEEFDTVSRFTGYDFVTLDPDALYNGQIVTIYTRPNSSDLDTYTFAYSLEGVPAETVLDTGLDSEPTTIDAQWYLSRKQMGDDILAFTWQVEKDADGTIRLAALGYQPDNDDRFPGAEYLRLYTNKDGNAVQTWWNDPNYPGIVNLTVNSGDGADCTIYSAYDKNYLVYDAETGDWVFGATGTTVYFAGVTERYEDIPIGNKFPDSVGTGDTTVSTLRFYNFVETGGEHIAALPGCTFKITGTDGYTYTIVSGENPELHLPADIPDGTYTIEEVSAPAGYLRDVNPKREFVIKDGKFVEENGSESIGTFLNHESALIDSDKMAGVQDYNNRVYEIILSLESNLRLYQMNPVDVLFVVDQSNSMLFPAGLVDTGLDITLYRNEGITTVDDAATNNTLQLDTLVETGKLDKSKVYYIIADEKTTSTVYAIWHNGVAWMYQDASYYAKAKNENGPGYRQDEGEFAIFPDDAATSEQPTKGTAKYIKEYDANGNPVYEELPDATLKANGGGLGYEIGNCTLGKDIAATEVTTKETTDADGNVTETTENVGTQKTYRIYTATNDYNRLHYLQDALAHAIHQLADANPENTVTLIRFNRATQHSNCEGPLALGPDHVNHLIDAVGNITTGGGTRQDIALKHVYDHLKGNVVTLTDGTGEALKNEDGTDQTVALEDLYTKGKDYTFTVLITDGAPVGSGNEKNLGVAESDTTSTADGGPVYDRIRGFAEQVREESILMTIGLGMGGVEGGGYVLEQIASEPSEAYHMMLNNADELMVALKQLLFSSMVPREKVDVMGDITDVISDSFYPVAYVPKGQGESTGRQVLYSDDNYDWIILEPGDWITIEGQYVGTEQGSTGAGRLTQDANGDFRITWDDQIIYDCGLVWVPTLEEVPSDRTLILAEENLGTNSNNGNAVGRYWFELNVGDYVYAHGEYAGTNASGDKSGTVGYSFLRDPTRTYQVAGRYVQGENRAHIVWNDYYNVDFDANFQPYTWSGKFYVKAKEDFIGGNAIDTNKFAQTQVQENDGDGVDEPLGTIALETPTVNVHLLDMNQSSSEVTVYLGDIINADGNSPLASVKLFYGNTYITKLISGDGDVLNAVDSADGLEEAVFYLRYAMGRDLTADEWNTLVNGGTVTVEYTYDNASSHGPVGYFTFQLTKTGDTANFEQHEATQNCDKQHTHTDCTAPVETYTLHVTYTAYKLGESGRPEKTVHNTEAGPGIEVGGADAGTTLAEGYGIVDKDNVHKVHVISGAIEITKEITGDLISDVDQTFTFTIHRQEDGDDHTGDLTLTVTVPAGQTTGTARVEGLKRGTYEVTEAVSDVYSIRSIQVLDTTNCYSEAEPTLLFRMGNDTADANVITGTPYTGYTGTPNGVFGAAKVVNGKTVYTGQVPVEKIWTDGADQHTGDEICLVLYDNGVPVTVNGENAYLLLNAGNNWQGTFTVYLSDVNDTVAKHSYSVREVAVTITETEWNALNETAQAEYVKLVFTEGETETVQYAKVAESETFVTVGDRDYLVEYGTLDDGTLTVTNHIARVMPESGGMGTEMYTFSGLLVIVAALMYYGYSQRRKRERRASQ